MVIEGCDPEKSENDNRILFDLTGRRLNPDDFPAEEETDEEEDQIVLLADVLGFGNETQPDADSDEENGRGLSEVLLNNGGSQVSHETSGFDDNPDTKPNNDFALN